MKILSLSLTLLLFIQANAWGLTAIVDEEKAQSINLDLETKMAKEINHEEAILNEMVESKAEKRFYQKFDRKYQQFRNEVSLFIDELSDDELLDMLIELKNNLRSHGQYDFAEAMTRNYPVVTAQDVRPILFKMISIEAQEESKQILKSQIAQAGGFKNYQKQAKAFKKEHLKMTCRLGKIAAITFMTPVVLIGMQSGLMIGAAIYFWSLSALELSLLVGTFLGIHVYVIPRMIYKIRTGCYKTEI